jgi:hypothetical protein
MGRNALLPAHAHMDKSGAFAGLLVDIVVVLTENHNRCGAICQIALEFKTG